MRHPADVSRLRPFEEAPRPLVGYAYDYAVAHDTGWHQHPRAQLLHATSGVMRVATQAALFIVPPGHRAVDAGGDAARDADADGAGDAGAVPARGRGSGGAWTR